MSKFQSGIHFLQIPGPTNVPERVLRAIDRAVVDHRGRGLVTRRLDPEDAHRHQLLGRSNTVVPGTTRVRRSSSDA